MPRKDLRSFSVLIGPHKVEVRTEPGTPKSSGFYGTCQSRKSGITIRLWDKGRRSRYSTLWHELLHAMSFATDAKLSEKQVVKLEHAFKSLCRKNPALVKKITRGI